MRNLISVILQGEVSEQSCLAAIAQTKYDWDAGYTHPQHILRRFGSDGSMSIES